MLISLHLRSFLEQSQHQISHTTRALDRVEWKLLGSGTLSEEVFRHFGTYLGGAWLWHLHPLRKEADPLGAGRQSVLLSVFASGRQVYDARVHRLIGECWNEMKSRVAASSAYRLLTITKAAPISDKTMIV